MKYYLTLCFCLLVVNLYALDPVKLKQDTEEVLVSSDYLQILEDRTGNLSIKDITSATYAKRFYRSKDMVPRIRDKRTTYWLKMEIEGAKSSNKVWMLEVLDLHINHIQVYVSSKGKLTNLGDAGYYHAFKKRALSHKNFVYQLPPEDKLTYFVRIKSEGFHPFLFKLRSTNFFIGYSLGEYYILGVYYGIMLIMAIYNIMLFMYIRDKMYLYYVIYVLSCVLMSFSEDGLGFQFLWSGFPEFNIFVENFANCLFLISFTIYAKTFLNFKTHLPKLDKYLNYLLVIVSLLFIVNSFSVLPFYTSNMHIYVILLPFIIIYVGAVKIYIRKEKSFTRFFLLGYSFTMIGIIIIVIRINGLVIDQILYVYSLNIGLLIEIVFFSLALAYRLRVIKNEKELAQAKMITQLQENEKIITQKVIERTEEIARQKAIIESKNEELTDANQTLQEQSEEIRRMNELLDHENQVLKGSVKELTKARVLMKDVDFSEFSEIFPDDDACYEYLAKLKWPDEHFTCIKCSNDKYAVGQGHYARRCSKCGYNESCTVNTIFHRSHIPIQKAFFMVFLVYANNENITSAELSKILSLRQSTCWKFSKKILEKIKSMKPASEQDQSDGWTRLIVDSLPRKSGSS
ncbi:MAG TPA: hypothetical protein DCS93_11450 [Microscillaceae bacterium]|nr:hypothetical protein [Microscillaceae bacterium]